MDSETVGMIQQYLDNHLKSLVLIKSVQLWHDTKKRGFISDEKSAVIGQLYGGALRLFSNTQGLEEKNIKSYDLKDFNDLFHSRLEGLEKQVENILNTEK